MANKSLLLLQKVFTIQLQMEEAGIKEAKNIF
jgi:hypothetical protein